MAVLPVHVTAVLLLLLEVVINIMINFLKVCYKIHKEERALKKEQAAKRKIAQLFNNRYTFKTEYVESGSRLSGTAYGGILPRAGYAWMCPECNKIHFPVNCSVWSGLQYPACCYTGHGHRLSHGIKLPSTKF